MTPDSSESPAENLLETIVFQNQEIMDSLKGISNSLCSIATLMAELPRLTNYAKRVVVKIGSIEEVATESADSIDQLSTVVGAIGEKIAEISQELDVTNKLSLASFVFDANSSIDSVESKLESIGGDISTIEMKISSLDDTVTSMSLSMD